MLTIHDIAQHAPLTKKTMRRILRLARRAKVSKAHIKVMGRMMRQIVGKG